MRTRSSALLLFLLCSPAIRAVRGAGASPQESPAIAAAAAIVKPQAYVSLAPVPRGRTFEVAVIAEIRNGYHMNNNKPADEFLIPTTLTAQLPKGLREVETIYPSGEARKFVFSQTPMLVYTGRVPLLVRIEVAADAPLGSVAIPMVLRYQACNDTTCLPPVKIPISVRLEIAPAGANARSVHPEIFSAEKSNSRK